MTTGWRVPGAVAALAVAGLLVGVLTAGGGDGHAAHPARAAAERFLDGYMEGSGRVVRRDQGGDTVSEGQAYAMLAAAAIGDRERFRRAWDWARAHLERRDGLLSWRWAHGRVADRQPAADADLDAARALLLGADRFDVPRYRAAALRIGRALLRESTVVTPRGRVLVAGPWARAAPYAVNPSYFSPRAFGALHRASGDRRWARTAAGARRVLAALGRRPAPDWARLDVTGGVVASGPPGSSGPPRSSFDAARVPPRFAESCSTADRRLAARYWPALRRTVRDSSHPVMLVAAAAAARAAGSTGAGDGLLDAAEDRDGEAPTYYGAAWVALGRIMLQTRLIESCRAKPS